MISSHLAVTKISKQKALLSETAVDQHSNVDAPICLNSILYCKQTSRRSLRASSRLISDRSVRN